MADLGEQEGQLEERESRILKNMFLLHETKVTDVMTPASSGIFIARGAHRIRVFR